MSAFPESGRSDWPKTTKMKVCFRPIADFPIKQKSPALSCGASDYYDDYIDSIVTVVIVVIRATKARRCLLILR